MSEISIALRHRVLLQALVRGHEASIAATSLRHCHCYGVDSLLFVDRPGARIRMFVAQPDHVLWQNDPQNYHQRPFSIGIHPHHCAVELEVVSGSIVNVMAHNSPIAPQLTCYRYHSKIIGGTGTFQVVGSARLQLAGELLFPGASRSLQASALHTIYVRQGETAAWLVYEGADDPAYEPLCYSDADLTKFDASSLYQPMLMEYLLEQMHSLGVV